MDHFSLGLSLTDQGRILWFELLRRQVTGPGSACLNACTRGEELVAWDLARLTLATLDHSIWLNATRLQAPLMVFIRATIGLYAVLVDVFQGATVRVGQVKVVSLVFICRAWWLLRRVLSLLLMQNMHREHRLQLVCELTHGGGTCSAAPRLISRVLVERTLAR